MALLGSEKALQLLRELGVTEYEGLDKQGNSISYDTKVLDKASEERLKNLENILDRLLHLTQ